MIKKLLSTTLHLYTSLLTDLNTFKPLSRLLTRVKNKRNINTTEDLLC